MGVSGRRILPESSHLPVLASAASVMSRPAGRALDAGIRRELEPRFNHDFGQVRIHTDAAAATAADRLHARAFTLGEQIHFGAGEYRPESTEGRRLVAHELAHVVQQSRQGATADAEARADGAATATTRGGIVNAASLGAAPIGIQRQAKPGAENTDPAPEVVPHQQWSSVLDGFELNSAKPTGAHAKQLDELAWNIALHVGMLRDGRVAIRVTGHTDRSGSEQYNVKLGQQRADAVRETLLEALKKQTIDASRIAGIPADSLGESAPAVATRDGVQEARNRRVEIAVSVGSVRPPPPPKKIDLTPIPPLPGTDRPLGPRRDPSPGDDLWKRMEEQRRKIEEYDRKHPRKTRSLQDVVIGKVMEDIVDPIVKKLPLSKDLREKVRDGIRKGLESGSEKACEAAVDASGATGSEAEALKSACKAALKAKSGGGGP